MMGALFSAQMPTAFVFLRAPPRLCLTLHAADSWIQDLVRALVVPGKPGTSLSQQN